jgi:hypothetical protein
MKQHKLSQISLRWTCKLPEITSNISPTLTTKPNQNSKKTDCIQTLKTYSWMKSDPEWTMHSLNTRTTSGHSSNLRGKKKLRRLVMKTCTNSSKLEKPTARKSWLLLLPLKEVPWKTNGLLLRRKRIHLTMPRLLGTKETKLKMDKQSTTTYRLLRMMLRESTIPRTIRSQLLNKPTTKPRLDNKRSMTKESSTDSTINSGDVKPLKLSKPLKLIQVLIHQLKLLKQLKPKIRLRVLRRR